MILTLIAISSAFGFFHIVAIGTFGLTLIDALEICMSLYALYHLIWLGKPLVVPKRIETVLLVSVLLVLTLSALSVAFAGDSELAKQSTKTFAHFIYLWMYAFLVYCMQVEPETWVKVLRVQLIVALFVALYGIYQMPARALDWPLAWLEISNVSFNRGADTSGPTNQLALQFGAFFRPTSFFSEPSAYATYSVTALSALLVPLFRRSTRIIKSKFLFWLILTTTSVAVFIAFSMTGILLLGSCIAVCLLLYWKRALRPFLLSLVVAVLVVGATDIVIEKNLGVSLANMFALRISSIVTGKAAKADESNVIGESMDQRVNDYVICTEIFLEHPIVGVGPGNFAKTRQSKSYGLQFPATTYGSVLAELGAIGFVVLMWFLVLLFVRTLSDERRWTAHYLDPDHPLEILLPIISIRMLFLILTGVAGNLLVSAVFWADIAMILSVQTAARKSMGGDSAYKFYAVTAGLKQILLNKKVEQIR